MPSNVEHEPADVIFTSAEDVVRAAHKQLRTSPEDELDVLSLDDDRYSALLMEISPGSQGSYIVQDAAEFFQLSALDDEGDEMDDWVAYEWSWELIDQAASAIEGELNQTAERLGSPVEFTFGTLEGDGSYCLFAMASVEEVEAMRSGSLTLEPRGQSPLAFAESRDVGRAVDQLLEWAGRPYRQWRHEVEETPFEGELGALLVGEGFPDNARTASFVAALAEYADMPDRVRRLLQTGPPRLGVTLAPSTIDRLEGEIAAMARTAEVSPL